jgi:hypothetical protein
MANIELQSAECVCREQTLCEKLRSEEELCKKVLTYGGFTVGIIFALATLILTLYAVFNLCWQASEYSKIQAYKEITKLEFPEHII